MKKAIVTIGDDRELTFDAYTSGFIWNNFEVPFLKEKDVLKCLTYIDEFDVCVCIEEDELVMYIRDVRNVISKSVMIEDEQYFLFDLGWTFEIA